MNVPDFLSLSPRQQHTLVVAMLVRNALEDFHAAHLSDAQMKELNRLIRYGIYDAVTLIETMAGDPEKEHSYEWLVAAIPDYWEIPGRDPDPTGRGQM
jgi:hypothetical protein